MKGVDRYPWLRPERKEYCNGEDLVGPKQWMEHQPKGKTQKGDAWKGGASSLWEEWMGGAWVK